LIVEVREGDRLVLSLEGQLVASTCAQLEAVVAEHWTLHRSLIVDLGGLTSIDSAGIALLIRIDDRCRLEPATFVAPASWAEQTADVAALADRFTWLLDGGAER
jgi:anti-anti-sigma regulatory factor